MVERKRLRVTTPFEKVTQVLPVHGRPGLYRGEIDNNWNAPIIPHGGVMTTFALRAMQSELANPDQTLRSVTTVFAGQVVPGPIEVDVHILRSGKSASQMYASVANSGSKVGHSTIAVFGGTRLGFSFCDLTMPSVPPVEDCRSFWDDPPEDFKRSFNPTFWRNVEGRNAIGHAPWEHWEPGTSERAYWYRFLETPRLADGTIDPFAIVTLCDTMPGAIGEKIGPSKQIWTSPSADLTVHLVGKARSEWLLAHNRARQAGDGYASVEMNLWDQHGGLVACATQVCIFSFPQGVLDTSGQVV